MIFFLAEQAELGRANASMRHLAAGQTGLSKTAKKMILLFLYHPVERE